MDLRIGSIGRSDAVRDFNEYWVNVYTECLFICWRFSFEISFRRFNSLINLLGLPMLENVCSLIEIRCQKIQKYNGRSYLIKIKYIFKCYSTIILQNSNTCCEMLSSTTKRSDWNEIWSFHQEEETRCQRRIEFRAHVSFMIFTKFSSR